MTLLFLVLDAMVAILVTLATTIQVLYLESLRIRARTALRWNFSKPRSNRKIGLRKPELWALTFSLVVKLSRMPGRAGLPDTRADRPERAGLGSGYGRALCWVSCFSAIVGTYVGPANHLPQVHGITGSCRWFPYFA